MAGTDNLTAKFAALGVDEPESWAESQRREGINQLARATLLVEFAAMVRSTSDDVLVETDFPTPDVRAAFDAIRTAGIGENVLRRVIEFSAALYAFKVLTLFDGATEPDRNPGQLAFALAVSNVASGSEASFETADLGLHESWGEVATAVLGKDAYWW
jgi:hypothetical protein